MSALAAKNLLEAGDIAAFRAGFARVFAHLPQPSNDREAEICMHSARTQAESVGLKHRAYSHRWLTERALPSGLPDSLKPSAERMYPRIVTAVGIASLRHGPLTDHLQTAMRSAVLEVYGDTPEGKAPDQRIVKTRMMDARERELRGLMGALKG